MWNQAITDLMTSGLTFAEATLWSLEWTLRHDGPWLAARAAEYRDVGFDATDGFWWFFCSIEPDVAATCANAGWRPNQVEALRDALTTTAMLARHSAATRPDQDDLNRWLSTGLSYARCVTYARAGIRYDEVPEWEARRLEGEDVDDSLAMLAALR